LPNNEWGDFQTPAELVRQALATLPQKRWGRVLEPTCGTGTFMREAGGCFPSAEVRGIEVNAEYADQARDAGQVLRASIFDLDLSRQPEWSSDGELLIVGNPPWVTNARLTTFGSINKPERRNLKALKGLDAVTGSSNFDIAEYIWLKLIVELKKARPTIALLCKTQVARNVFSYCVQVGIGIEGASIRRVDAKRWFNAVVDACLFTVSIGHSDERPRCAIYDGLSDEQPGSVMGFSAGQVVSDIVAYEAVKAADGRCEHDWRQGIKHDAVSVMELRSTDGAMVNGRGDIVDVEPGYVFPLLKSTDVFRGKAPSRVVVVPQRTLGQETSSLAASAPRLWRYLEGHSAVLDGRKSSIYRGKPRYSVFGIGGYSFADWKIAISGMHKQPVFRLVGPIDGKPVFLDDTCYLLPFNDAVDAVIVHSLLVSPTARRLLESLVFWDSKRPITKKLLSRVRLSAVLALEGHDVIAVTADETFRALKLEAPVPYWNELLEGIGSGSDDAAQLCLA